MVHKYKLIVEEGDPYEKGSEIGLPSSHILIGRPWKDHQPDIPFTSLYISKKHASIDFDQNRCIINDLDSKHGTQINGIPIQPYQPCFITHGDLIGFAQGIVNLRVCAVYDSEVENTIDLIQSNTNKNDSNSSLLIVTQRREVFIEGNKISLFGKDLTLLLVLFENRNRALSYNEIKAKVWPERPMGIDSNVPDVGNDEITALVYRLRKRLNNFGSLIVSIPRYGYRLDL